ncbi:DNA primase [Pseudomonas sp. F1002]|nr:DNA primase [Pseudomonas sp. F1002]
MANGQSAIGWDEDAKLFFALPGSDLERVRDWWPDSTRRAGGGDAEAEFLDALTQEGLIIRGMPIMDGERQRVATVEDKNGKKSGVYRGFSDRRPGGWFINYHRAETEKSVTNWSATGGENDPITSLHIRAGARQSQDDAERARQVKYAEQTLAAKALYDRLPSADPAHPYLERKGIEATPELRQTRNGALVVPFFNASGEFRTLQYIPPAGDKYLFKDAPKQGHFLVVGGSLQAGQPVLYAEGYATARSLNQATGQPVVMTIDAGNMVAVAKVLHQQYPDSLHLFLADLDHTKDVNKGLLMATQAAELIGGQVLYPNFTDEEKALGLTDFNDLHLSRGLDAVLSQVAPALTPINEERTMQDDNTPGADTALQSPLPESSPSSDNLTSAAAESTSSESPVVQSDEAPGAVITPQYPLRENLVPTELPLEPDTTNAPAEPTKAPVVDVDLTPIERSQLQDIGWTDELMRNYSAEEARQVLAAISPSAPGEAPLEPDSATVPAEQPSAADESSANASAPVSAQTAEPTASDAPVASGSEPSDPSTLNAGAQGSTGDAGEDLTPFERNELRGKGWTDDELWNISVEDARAALAGTFPLAKAGPVEPDDQNVPTSVGEPVATPREGKTLEGEVPQDPQGAVDSIRVGPPRPNGEEARPQAGNIDMDALLARLEPKLQPDKSVLYSLDGEPAFIDRGTRLDMAEGASQNEEKVLAALLTAAQYYRGRIELTGSDAFQRTAIGLIAKYQLNVMMKNPGQQVQLEAARKAMATAPVEKDAIAGEAPPAYGPPQLPASPATPATPAAPATNTPASTDPAFAEDPLVTMAVFTNSPKATVEQAQPDGRLAAEESTAAVKSQAAPKIPTSIHQSTEAAKMGITGKVMDSGNAPFRFDEKNGDSVFIKLRTKTGIETFWGKELAGLLRESRVQPGAMVTLKWLGKEPVVVKVPIKDDKGDTKGFEEKNAHRNQWSLALMGGATVRTGQDEGVKLSAYEAHRFNQVQQELMTRLRLETPLPSSPKDGLYWMTPNGQGSAKVGDELTAPRPGMDKETGKPVMSSWSADGHLEMALVRGDGPYLQGVVRHDGDYRHVLVSLPGSQDAPPMVINAITPEGLVPIGAGNAINQSGGEAVSRENIAFKLDGDTAVRIGKLDNPADVNPVLHARLGFDERWRDDNTLPKSAPAAAPTVQPGAHRPA